MRKLLLVFALLCGLCRPSLAAVTLVQCATPGDWSSGTSWTVGITATSGNLLVLAVHFQAGNGSNDVTGSPSDTANTYTAIDSYSAVLDSDSRYSLHTYYAKITTGGSLTITQNISTSVVSRARMYLCELTGQDATTPLDGHEINVQVAPGSGSNAVTSCAPSCTTATTANGDWVYGTSGGIFSITYSLGTSPNMFSLDAKNGFGISEYFTQTSAGALQATATVSNGTHTQVTAVAAFKAAASASTPRRQRCTTLGVC